MTAPLVTPSRAALEQAECPDCGHLALSHHIAGDCNVTIYGSPEDGFYPSEHCNCDRTAADALLASGVVRAADTLADDEALVERVRANVYATPRYYPTSTADILRALATALESR